LTLFSLSCRSYSVKISPIMVVEKLTVTKLIKDIYLIRPPGPDVPGPTSAYLVRDEQCALIETGPEMCAEGILEGIKQIGVETQFVSYIIPTHVHIDHAGGAGYLAQKMPWARVLVHSAGARHLIDPTALIAGTKLAFGEDFEKQFGSILPVPERQIMEVKDGDEIKLGKRKLRIIYSPGHATHHFAIYDDKSNGLFCGESLGLPREGDDLVVPVASLPVFDMDAALESIDKLEKLAPEVLFYSHNGMRKNAMKYIRESREQVKVFGDLISQGMQAGEDPQQLKQRIKKHLGLDPQSESSDFNLLVGGYMAYFLKKAQKGT